VNYYKFHIGDYHKSTLHLTAMEDLAYRRLLDLYYDRESPLPLDFDSLVRLIRMKGFETETQQILSGFFKRTKKGWIQKRVELELKSYAVKACSARENGKKGGRPKKTQSVILAYPNESQKNLNHKPLTNNQEPIKTFAQFWEVYPRKKGKAEAEKKWGKLSPEEKQQAFDDCQTRYIDEQPTYIPYGSTYLNKKFWEDADTESYGEGGI